MPHEKAPVAGSKSLRQRGLFIPLKLRIHPLAPGPAPDDHVCNLPGELLRLDTTHAVELVKIPVKRRYRTVQINGDSPKICIGEMRALATAPFQRIQYLARLLGFDAP